jgi:predicted component of type VI protein secretion system
VSVKRVEGKIGEYDAIFELRPHFKLEKLGAKLTLVSRVTNTGA